MKRTIVVTLIAIVVLAGGFYLYLNSQKEKSEPQQTGGQHGSTTTTGGHQAVSQGQRTYEPEVTSDTTNVRPNQPIKFSYKIKNDKGDILKNYEVAHEKIMHFIVVRKDLQEFQHLHPDFNQQTGEFTVDITFPTDGPYRVFPDFTPAVDNPQELPVTVYHDVEVGNSSKHYAQSVVPDTEIRKKYEEYVIVTTFPKDAKKQSEITYTLDIYKKGEPLTNLENYLGALGHSVILKEVTLDFIHTHAGETGTGPKIEFAATFPESGIYKIFTQFQDEGKVQTTNYTVKVN